MDQLQALNTIVSRCITVEQNEHTIYDVLQDILSNPGEEEENPDPIHLTRSQQRSFHHAQLSIVTTLDIVDAFLKRIYLLKCTVDTGFVALQAQQAYSKRNSVSERDFILQQQRERAEALAQECSYY